MARVPVMTRIASEAVPLVDAAAARLRVSRSEYIRLAVAAALQDQEGVRRQIARAYPAAVAAASAPWVDEDPFAGVSA